MINRILLSLLLVFCGLAVGLVVSGRMHQAEESLAAPAAVPQRTAAPPAQAPVGGQVPDFSDVASRAVNGVVNVSSLQVVRTQRSPLMNDPFFRYFFGDDFGPQDRRSLSLGSGVI